LLVRLPYCFEIVGLIDEVSLQVEFNIYVKCFVCLDMFAFSLGVSCSIITQGNTFLPIPV